MKKQFIAILVIQAVLMIFLLMYAFLQKLESDKQRVIAETVIMDAERHQNVLTAELEKVKAELENCK